MSGRRGRFVFYMRRGKLCRRRHVIPKDVRTPARRRTRRAFGAIAKAWSWRLTQAQHLAWIAAAAKVRSHPRLGQSGPLTGQQHFEGINSARARIGLELLLWPPERVVFGPNPVGQLAINSGRDAFHRVPVVSAGWGRGGTRPYQRRHSTPPESHRAGDRGHHGLCSGPLQPRPEEVAARRLSRPAPPPQAGECASPTSTCSSTANPSRARRSLSARASRRTAGKATTTTSPRWFQPRRPAHWPGPSGCLSTRKQWNPARTWHPCEDRTARVSPG